MVATEIPLIVIVGPTASGKSSLAMKIAQKFSGEIICADSRTIYKGASIGTAKPSKAEQAKVKHWGLDLVEPGQNFTTADYKKYADAKITEVKLRGHLPILVGGTGLYIDSVLFDYQFRIPSNTKNRSLLEVKTVQELQQIILKAGYALPENQKNKRHLIRTIESSGQLPAKGTLHSDAAVFGIMPTTEQLKQQITDRSIAMFNSGITTEVEALIKDYGAVKAAQAGVGYQALVDYVSEKITLKQAQAVFITTTWQYARRQRTWFKRHDFIQWSSDQTDCYKKIVQFLTTDNK